MTHIPKPDIAVPAVDLDAESFSASTDLCLQTAWIVITGAPCSGKSSLVSLLGQMGYQVSPEPARAYFEEQSARGLSIDEIRSAPEIFMNAILARAIQREALLDPHQLTFMDRALPDSAAFRSLYGLDFAELQRVVSRVRYRAVVLLESLPFEADGVRTESEEFRSALEQRLVQVYEALGYRPVRIPVVALEVRAQLLLDQLRNLIAQ